MTERNKEETNILKHSDAWQGPFQADGTAKAKERVMARIDGLKGHDTKVFDLRGNYSLRKVAAAVAMVIGLPFLVYFLSYTKFEHRGEMALSINLPDGSKAMLSPESTLSYHTLVWPISRRMELEGEAHFDIKPGTKCVVSTAGGDVHVKGTSFSVWGASGSLLVHCLSGNVEVSNSVSSIDLHDGQLCTSNPGYPNLRKHDFVAAEPILPQRDDILNFDNAPLVFVYAELQKSFNVRVISGLPSELRYTGQLNRHQKEETFEVLCKTFGASWRESDGSIILMP
jgi:ferric-dicitrate binding protein FerR (iron transport regulator)